MSKRTGTSNSKPAVMATPAAGAVVKVTRPVAEETDQPEAWGVPFRAIVTVPATGLITFTTAPATGTAITAGFEFDVPVRFDSDALDVTLDLERFGSITSIPLLEIRT